MVEIIEVKTQKQIKQFIEFPLKLYKNCPYFVIGNGSNILASDNGYKGVVVKLIGDFDRILIRDEKMECGAGVTLAKAYVFAREKCSYDILKKYRRLHQSNL